MSRNLENRREAGKDDAKEQPQKALFARKSGLLSTLKEGAKRVAAVATIAAAVGCVEPEVTINNIPYDPDAPDGGSCSALTENCQESVTVTLREESSTAGSNSAKVENATLTLVEIVDEDSTKAAVLELEACEDIAEGTFTSGQTITLTVAGSSFDVAVDSIEYDGEGAKVTVTAMPPCPVVDDAGTETDTGSD